MDYRFEEARLDSYRRWPNRVIDPTILAAAGFYYTQDIDRVRCFECRMEIACWEAGDDPWTLHMRWSSRCRFMRQTPCGNVPLGANPAFITPPGRGHSLKYLEPPPVRLTTPRNHPPISEVNPQADPTTFNASTCTICLAELRNTVFLPCTHLVACRTCSNNIIRCVVCREIIHQTLRIYLA